MVEHLPSKQATRVRFPSPALQGGTPMKHCSRCGEAKPLDQFGMRGRCGRRQAYCKPCLREYQQGRPRILLAKRLVREQKNGPCADCGVQYPPFVLDFDHRPGTKKIANLNVLVKRGAKQEVLLAEIAKCDLVCANCHRIRTWQRKRGAIEHDGREAGCCSSVVERHIGNVEVLGSTPSSSSRVC
jgi:hypothetical protein